jgi:hypothetical protein
MRRLTGKDEFRWLCISCRQHTRQSGHIYITLIPLPVTSVYTHPQEGYIQFKTYYIK